MFAIGSQLEMLNVPYHSDLFLPNKIFQLKNQYFVSIYSFKYLSSCVISLLVITK